MKKLNQTRMMNFGQSTISEGCESGSWERARKSFSGTIRLEPDVAEVFRHADAVNEALRFLIRVIQEKKPSLHNTKQ
jgi:hypothetical protein